MASISSKVKWGYKMLVHWVEWKVPDFKLTPAIVETLDPSSVKSQIPPKVLLINDICTHSKFVIQEIGTLEMDDALGQPCVNGALKSKHQHLETNGLKHIPHMPHDF